MKQCRVIPFFVVLALTLTPVLARANSGDFSGAVAIGTSYAGVSAGPTDGLIIQGNVGIGTTTVSHALELNGTLNASGAVSGPVATWSGLNTASGFVPSGSTVTSNGMYLSAANTLDFSTNTTKALEISSTGAVTIAGLNSAGVVTTNSSGTLATNATLPAGQFPALTGDVTTAGSSLSTTVAKIQGTTVSGTTGTGNVMFSASPTTTGTFTGAAANFSGNVGIGTTTPGYQLELYGTSNAATAMAIRTPGTGTVQQSNIDFITKDNGAGLGAAGNKGWSVLARGNAYTGDANNFEIWYWNGTSYLNAITALTSGNVGIGTTSPAFALDVNGKVHIGSFAAASSTTVCSNGGVLSTCSSARRFKENIKPSELGLKEVLAMRPVTFDFKKHKDNWEKHDFGFIAEDMEKINPLFVTYDDKGEIEGVRYMQLTAVNAKAIQELYGDETKDVKELQGRIDKQQAEIDELKRQIEQQTHRK